MPEPVVRILREHARDLKAWEKSACDAKLIELYALYPEDDTTVQIEFNAWCDEAGIP